MTLREFVQNPITKISIDTLSVISFSVFSGCFVTDITSDGKIIWLNFYHSTSFYILVLLIFLWIPYKKYHYDEEVSVEKFMDDDYCNAYIKKEGLRAAASRMSELIRGGKSDGQIKDLMSKLNQ